jgi:DNA-directed RNA polymerase subunit omega
MQRRACSRARASTSVFAPESPRFRAANLKRDFSAPLFEGTHLISPRVDRLLDNVDSPYASVVVAAKRARQINSYYHNLGEGTFEEFPPPMIDTGSKNYLTIALEEVAGGKIKYRYRG